MSGEWALRFLGTGAAHAHALGNASAVLERAGRPALMIDCGPDALIRYLDHYGAPPPALYLTHLHLDHVGGMEELFHRTWFDPAHRGQLRLYVHADLVPLLERRIADYPRLLTEGGVNFWEAFRLIPCSRGFWHEDYWFEVFPTRHNRIGTSFGLALPGSFVWTGDTRPVPEALALHAARGELVAHDCCLKGNPSHAGLDDIEREYPPALRQRLVLYHYGSAADGAALAAHGLHVAVPGECLALPPPAPVTPATG